MTVNLRVMVPDATANYILNPALRYDTTGYTASGSTITRVLTQARFGIASLKVVTNGVAIREGTYYRVSSLVGISEPITVSAYVRGTGAVHIRLIDNPAGKEWVSLPVVLQQDRWKRMEISGFSTGSDDLRLYVETDGNPKAITFYADGFQMERKAYSTSYCDGDQPGCRWNVVDHNSIATRDAYTRQGGRWIPLAGPCRYNDDIYVTVLSGLGMAPITNNVQSWALAAGSFYQNTKITDRVVSLSFTVKKKDLRFHTKPDLTRLRKLRQELIEVFKPDRTAGGEPFLFSYDEGDKELFVWLRYEAGLEGEWDIRNPYTNSFPVRLIAVDPILFEDSQDAYALNFISRELMNCIACRKNGEWKSMNYGLNSVAYSMAVGKKTDLYVGGNFTVVNNNAVAINPLLLANRLAVWDGTSFSALSSVGPTMIYTVAIAPNGDIYVGGAFTTIGGVAANRIARWDGATWNALGTGLTGGVGTNCYRITIAPNGDVYAAGNFTAAGGITVHEIARWSGGAWHSMGTYAGLNSSVMAMVIDPMGTTLYLGGVFTDQYSLAGTALSMVASYNPTTNLFSPVGLGFNSPPDDVETLAFSPSGKLYAGGGFVSSGTTVLNRIAMFNGSAWVPLGTGMNDYIWEISVDKNENVIATGPFTTAGGVPVTRIALWNGTSWNQADAYPDASKDVREVVISPAGDVYICGDFIYLIHSAITYITNRGTTETKPIIYISGPGYLHWIENQTTQQRVYINLNISVGEEIVIDFGRGTIHSNTRGDMNYTILSGSDFANFSLSPGENKLCCFMDHDTNAGMYIYSTPQHWSVDAIVPQEDLG